MGFLGANGEKEGLPWFVAEVGGDGGGDVYPKRGFHGQLFVVANEIDAGILKRGEVLDAAEDGLISVAAEDTGDVPAGIGDGEATVGEAEHAAAMGGFTGEESGAAG